jgi:hypothetical protein
VYQFTAVICFLLNPLFIRLRSNAEGGGPSKELEALNELLNCEHVSVVFILAKGGGRQAAKAKQALGLQPMPMPPQKSFLTIKGCQRILSLYQ